MDLKKKGSNLTQNQQQLVQDQALSQTNQNSRIAESQPFLRKNLIKLFLKRERTISGVLVGSLKINHFVMELIQEQILNL